MKTFLKILIIACLIIGVTSPGCESTRRKFVRKKEVKEERAQLIYIDENIYSASDVETLYRRYYLYWRSWEDELINDFGNNHLADMKNIDNALTNLKKMQGMLTGDGAAKMQGYIDQLSAVYRKLEKNKLSPSETIRIVDDLNKHKLRIEKSFVYSKIIDFIKIPDAKSNN